jgi:hypothetical protein
MSTRYNDGSHYENHQRAAELQKGASHPHAVGEQHGKQDHLTAHEPTHQADEYSGNAHRNSHFSEGAHEIRPSDARGCPQGSPEIDWFQAVKQLRSRALAC